MTDTSITISVLNPNNEAKTAKLSYVNPLATKADLIDFAQDYVGLTDNTYISTSRTDTVKLD